MGLIERGQPDLSLSSALKVAEGLNLTLGELMLKVEASLTDASQTAD